MRLATYHAHTTRCDGGDSPSRLAEAALASGMTDLGYSAHAAWPFATEWHLSPGDYEAYVAEIRELERRFAGKLRIRCGFEADYLPGVSAPDKGLYARFKIDYLIGSIHYVGADYPGEIAEPWSVDGPTETVAATLDAAFGGDGKRAVRAYWSLMRDMVGYCRFDIVGHADIIRKRNGALGFFDESAPWYRRELETTAKAIARAGKIVEINTGAISRGAMDDLYPSAEFLSILSKHGARLTVNSDAHAAKDLTSAYDRAYRAAREAGFTQLWFLDSGGWVPESL